MTVEQEVVQQQMEQPPKVVDPVDDVIVDGPPMAESLANFDEKKLKKVLKEGGKRGVEIEGAADMGGLQFFCTTVNEPEGNLDLLIETMKAMNARSDPSEEERKGGAGKIGKLILSCVDEHLVLVAYVPKDKGEKCNAKEWLTHTIETTIANKDKVAACVTIEECPPVSAAHYAKALIKSCPDKDVFSLKLRDACISIAYQYLKARDLFPDGDDEEDDEFVFGDEDFPEYVEEPTGPKTDLLQPVPERLQAEKLEKRMKKVLKEGGKRGVEIEGAADMGGLKFFCTEVQEPAADVDWLVESMRAMNMDSDPSEEERRGGSKKIGKTIFSMTDDALCMVAYVPEETKEECCAKDWLINTATEVLKGGKHGDDVGDVAKGLVETYEGNEKTFAKVVIKKDFEKGLFPLKMKDACINSAYAYLKARKLFPDGNDESDDEYVFGDEDFPE